MRWRDELRARVRLGLILGEQGEGHNAKQNGSHSQNCSRRHGLGELGGTRSAIPS
jgi:hypothetical protein